MRKISLKIHALARIADYMSKNKLRVIMKAFIESQFGYCRLVWMFHSRTLNNRINRPQERALRLVYKDPLLTIQQLLEKDNSFMIHERNLQKLATEIFKVKKNLSPKFMSNIFPETTNPYNVRSKNTFNTFNGCTFGNGTETISFRGPKTWALVPEVIKNSNLLPEFKGKIKNWKPEGCMCRLCTIYIPNLGFI